MKIKPLLLYLDTSVIGGYFDMEFSKETVQLFNSILKGEYRVLYSSVTENELLGAPDKFRESYYIKFQMNLNHL